MLDGPVLVTGGAKRIGAVICRALAARGASVVVHARASVSEAEALAKEIGGAVVVGDLADPDAAEGIVDAAAAAAGGPIQYVVNNASAFPKTRLKDASYEDVDVMMRLHAWAPLAITRAASAQGAQAVVNILDTRVTSHDPAHMPYLLSKQALLQLTRTLARELAPMRVNGVAPGPILEADDGDLDAAIRATILGRQGSPEDVAHAVAFMLEAEYTTGDVVFVDGGRHLRT